ncbi:MAG: Gfo/Idh/MocA family oxidoreductase [Puniceicoccales bacterium]|nr:Gfo/Idh/MocA family oxidoreductase [Puniceicoccales bacterium]
MSQNNIISLGGTSRRRFITNCAAAAASIPVLAGLPTNVFAAGANDGIIRIGLVGAGGRGTDAVGNILEAARIAKKNVKVVAVGDVFADAANGAAKRFGAQAFVGFDAYKKVLDAGIDIVILATAPGFRPVHIAAAVEKGVHIFAEKPVATDPAGARLVLEAAAKAKEKKLSFVAGTQRRHQNNYIETLKRIHDGEIGEIVGGQVYWCMGGLWHKGRKPEWTEIEYQVRNWLYFTWLSGDHIVEQHVHNIDVANWAFGAHPAKVFGMGGRQSRTGKEYGDAFDHFSIEYEYPNGARVQSFCRQAPGANDRVTERLVGTKGVAVPGAIYKHGERRPAWRYSGGGLNPYVQEHVDLLKSITGEGPYQNEGVNVAESTLSGIIGRMSAYTGREISYKWALEASKLDIVPKDPTRDTPAPVVEIAVPGRTRLI